MREGYAPETGMTLFGAAGLWFNWTSGTTESPLQLTINMKVWTRTKSHQGRERCSPGEPLSGSTVGAEEEEELRVHWINKAIAIKTRKTRTKCGWRIESVFLIDG
jgi:hypothetical protein